MKPYRDMFGNKISQKDVRLACQAVIGGNATTSLALNRATNLGVGKANRIMGLLEDAGVVAKSDKTAKRLVILRTYDSAVNAANRQLKKGRSNK